MKPTREQIIERYRHEFGGMIADVVSTDKRGAELARRLSLNFARIDQLIGQMYDELSVEQAPPSQPSPRSTPAGIPAQPLKAHK